MDDLRFMNPWEAYDEIDLFQTTLQTNNKESCVANTPNTMVNCIGALVWRRDGDTSVIWIVDIGFCNLKNYKNSKVACDKTDHKRYSMLENKA